MNSKQTKKQLTATVTYKTPSMVTIWSGDMYELIKADGWERGAYWSEPGLSGYWLRHPERHPEWLRVRCTPCGEDSLCDDDGWCGPSGSAESATDALMDRLECESEMEVL